MVGKNNAMGKLVVMIAIFISCSTTKQSRPMYQNTSADTSFLASLFKENPAYFAGILKNSKDWNVQVIYTRVDRNAKGVPELTDHYYHVDPDRYFYPASTVKLPVVLLALQKLNELKGRGIDLNTTMLTETAFSGQSPVFNDPTTPDGRPTIAHYIKKILMVSDNDAFNRLYEFLGQEYINNELRKKGYNSAQILHRLDIFLTEEENRRTNPVKFYNGTTVQYDQAPQKSELKYISRKDSLGKGYYKAGQLVDGAMDFSKKNRIGLQDLHRILLSLVFPDKVKVSERFNITESDRQFVLKYMSQYPTESVYPPYSADTVNYWPAYCKFLLFGAQKGDLPENIRIFNKVGDAYGHMIDVAYIVDYKNKIEFFVSAIIYCNSDGILNDDKYDYETIGKPFMQNLGKVLYEYELKRNHTNRPDLSSVLFKYDTTPPKQ